MRQAFITFFLNDLKPRRVPVKDEISVLDVALTHAIDLAHSCGGMGSCTTCRVFLESDPDAASPRTELEQEIASSRNFDRRERLACQLEPRDGLIVRIPQGKLSESI